MSPCPAHCTERAVRKHDALGRRRRGDRAAQSVASRVGQRVPTGPADHQESTLVSKRFFAALLGAGALAVGALTAGVARGGRGCSATSPICPASMPSGSAPRPPPPDMRPVTPGCWSTGRVPSRWRRRRSRPLCRPIQLRSAL